MKIKYTFTTQKATPFGGLALITELLNSVKFADCFNNVFGQFRKVRYFKPYENIQLLLATILSGGERLYDIDQLKSDPVLPNLFGNGKVPADTTLRDDLERLGTMNEQRRELLFRLNAELFRRQGLRSITIDIDATALPVDGHQEGAEKGYCPAEPGSRCFQNLSAVCDQTKTTLDEETRPGNTHCSLDSIPFVERILDRFAPLMERIVMRLDTGFFSEAMLKKAEAYPNVIYEIGVPQHSSMQERVRCLDYKSYHGSPRQYAKFQRFSEPGRWYYVERTRKPFETQLDLLDTDDYTYRVVVSNDARRQPHTLFGDYNGRGRDEQQIGELKGEYALGRLVSGDFRVMRALTWVSHLAYTLIGLFKRLVLRGEEARLGLRRLRYLLFANVAYLTHHSREWTLNLCEPRLGERRFRYYLHRSWALQ